MLWSQTDTIKCKITNWKNVKTELPGRSPVGRRMSTLECSAIEYEEEEEEEEVLVEFFTNLNLIKTPILLVFLDLPVT
jgi:hypothetical protein